MKYLTMNQNFYKSKFLLLQVSCGSHEFNFLKKIYSCSYIHVINKYLTGTNILQIVFDVITTQ